MNVKQGVMTVAKPLIIEKNPFGMGDNIRKITGLTDEQLRELKSLENKKAMHKLLDIIDEHNDGLGTQWWRSDIVSSLWFDNEFAYVKLFDPCD